MRRAAKRDHSEKAIVEALEAVGAFVWRQDEPVDLDVYYRERWLKLECKTPEKNGKVYDRKKDADQRAFCKAFNVPIVSTPAEALAAIGASVITGYHFEASAGFIPDEHC